MDGAMDRILRPGSKEVEAEVLGAVLVDPTVMGFLAQNLTPQDFNTVRYESVFRGMVHCHEAGSAVDTVLLKEALLDLDLWGSSGGFATLSEVLGRNGCLKHLEHYVNRMLDLSASRRMLEVSEQVAAIAIDGELSPRDALSEAERVMGGLREGVRTGDGTDAASAVGSYMAMVAAIQDGEQPSPRISTGIEPLDRVLGGGFRSGWLVLVTSLNGHGKTALAVNGFAWAVAKAGRPVLIVSLEMPAEQLFGRLIAAESGVPVSSHDSGKLTPEQLSHLTYGADRVSTAPIRVSGHECGTIEATMDAARSLKAERGDLGMVVVDYIQLMRHAARASNRTEELERVSRGLKEMAMELDCVVVGISQPTMAAKRTKTRPSIRDSKGSGAIDDDADVGLVPWLPHNVDDAADVDAAEIGIDKFRHGARRDLGPNDVAWDGPRMRFVSRGPF